MYSIVLSKRFDRDFSNLNKEIQGRVVETLKEISKNPRTGKPLRGKLKGLCSTRVGDYRIVYRISDEKKMVMAVTVRHRKTVYK